MLSVATIGAALSFGAASRRRRGQERHRRSDPPRAGAEEAADPRPVDGRSGRPAASAAEGKFVDTIRGRSTRSLSSSEREQIATIAKDKPNIDLEITFDYNSADISAKSQPPSQALGKALSNPD